MVFDSFKKIFRMKRSQEEYETKRQMKITEEMDDYEKEIQSYITYSGQRHHVVEPESSPAVPQEPAALSKGQGIMMTGKHTSAPPPPQPTQENPPQAAPEEPKEQAPKEEEKGT